MKRLAHRTAITLILTCGFMFTVLPSANAYIDPGSGSYMIQVLAGGFVAVLAGIAVFGRRIAAFFGRLLRRG